MKLAYTFTGLLWLAATAAYAAQEGQSVPQCPAQLAESQQSIDFDAFKGKVVLIDFWATWCGPCQKSMPFLNKLRNERRDEGFEIVAINVDEDREEAVRFLQAHPVDYLMAFDPKGDCPSAFGVQAMPSSFFIDKTGKIRKVHLGYRDGDQEHIRDQVSSLLAE